MPDNQAPALWGITLGSGESGINPETGIAYAVEEQIRRNREESEAEIRADSRPDGNQTTDAFGTGSTPGPNGPETNPWLSNVWGNLKTRVSNSPYNPWAYRDTHNASAVDQLMGRKDIASPASSHFYKPIVSGLGMLGGPLMGWAANKAIDYFNPDGYNNPNKWQYSPTNPNDPYGVHADAARTDNVVDDIFGQQLPHSNIADGITNPFVTGYYNFGNPAYGTYNTAPPAQISYAAPDNNAYLADPNARGAINPNAGYNNAVSSGGSYAATRGGSITGDGQYGYATRLRARGSGTSGGAPTKIDIPVPTTDED